MTDHVRQLFDLSGKVALVTGGSRGLGLEMATALGEAGAVIVVTARREAWLSDAVDVLRRAGIKVYGFACDITRQSAIEALVSSLIAQTGRVDVLVNNAGISWGAPLESMPETKWREVMDTNVTGAFLMSQAIGREFIRTGDGGAIINVTSIAGIVGTRREILDAVGYTASKGALIALTRDFSVKWATQRIRVNAIAPGFFPTRLSSGVIERARQQIESSIPMGRIGQPGELKGVTVFLASAASSYITGQVIAVDGGATAW